MICAYNFGTFKPNQLKYIIFEKELLAIKLSLERFKIYLAPEDFIVRTSNKDVSDFFINKKSINQGQRLSWYIKIAEYTFEVEHCK